MLQKADFSLVNIGKRMTADIKHPLVKNKKRLEYALDVEKSKDFGICIVQGISKVDGAINHVVAVDFTKRLIYDALNKRAMPLTLEGLDMTVPGCDGCNGILSMYQFQDNKKKRKSMQ